MNKNVAIACGLGDLFVFITRLEDFFKKNPEYSSISFWTWLHSPKLAKELLTYSNLPASILSVDEIVSYLDSIIDPSLKVKAEKHYIKQSPTGIGVDGYIKFMEMFFPNIEQWIYLPTYLKYKSTYPFRLNVTPAKPSDRPYIVVHPVSTTVKTEKKERQWQMRRWGGALNLITQTFKGTDVVFIGTKNDIIEVPGDISSKFIDMRGKLSLGETIALIYGAKAVLGTNSWPTLMAMWAEIPTYEQWFVQHQLIPTHHPKPVEEMKHVFLEKNSGSDPSDLRTYLPSSDQAWVGIRKVLDYAKCSV